MALWRAPRTVGAHAKRCDSADDITTFVSTVDDGTNPFNRQQQVVAMLPIL
jgi:hypothetical protein